MDVNQLQVKVKREILEEEYLENLRGVPDYQKEEEEEEEEEKEKEEEEEKENRYPETSRPPLLYKQKKELCGADERKLLSSPRILGQITPHNQISPDDTKATAPAPLKAAKRSWRYPVTHQSLLQNLAPAHRAELAALWVANPRIPTLDSRYAWAAARNLNPSKVHVWFQDRRKMKKRRPSGIPEGTYDMPVGTPPVIVEEPILVKEESTPPPRPKPKKKRIKKESSPAPVSSPVTAPCPALTHSSSPIDNTPPPATPPDRFVAPLSIVTTTLKGTKRKDKRTLPAPSPLQRKRKARQIDQPILDSAYIQSPNDQPAKLSLLPIKPTNSSVLYRSCISKEPSHDELPLSFASDALICKQGDQSEPHFNCVLCPSKKRKKATPSKPPKPRKPFYPPFFPASTRIFIPANTLMELSAIPFLSRSSDVVTQQADLTYSTNDTRSYSENMALLGDCFPDEMNADTLKMVLLLNDEVREA